MLYKLWAVGMALAFPLACFFSHMEWEFLFTVVSIFFFGSFAVIAVVVAIAAILSLIKAIFDTLL